MLIRDWTMQQGEDGKPEFDIVAETHSLAHYTYPELSPPIAPEPPLGGGGSAARVPPGAPQILNPRPTYEDYAVIPRSSKASSKCGAIQAILTKPIALRWKQRQSSCLKGLSASIATPMRQQALITGTLCEPSIRQAMLAASARRGR